MTARAKLLTLPLAALLLASCVQLLGLDEKRPVDGAGGAGGDDSGGSVDPDTGLPATAQCIEYCDALDANCTGDLAQYSTRDTCITVCGALPPGQATDPTGNTVSCRLKQAQNAASLETELSCLAAGPDGGDICGTACESYCSQLELGCPIDFRLQEDCERGCHSFADEGTFNATDFVTGDTLQCRLWHVGAALQTVDQSPNPHCSHARFEPESTCVDDPLPEPSCRRYCDRIAAICDDPSITEEPPAVYESDAQCMAVCSVFDLGDTANPVGNTVACRTYHAGAASTGTTTHCPHASPTGDGTCGDSATGICDSYCALLAAGCPSSFVDVATCQLECAGLDDGKGYSVEKAEASEADGLSCRFLGLSRALASSDEAHCPGGASDPCP